MKTNRISIPIAFFLFSIFILSGPDLSGQTDQESKKETKTQKKADKAAAKQYKIDHGHLCQLQRAF